VIHSAEQYNQGIFEQATPETVAALLTQVDALFDAQGMQQTGHVRRVNFSANLSNEPTDFEISQNPATDNGRIPTVWIKASEGADPLFTYELRDMGEAIELTQILPVDETQVEYANPKKPLPSMRESIQRFAAAAKVIRSDENRYGLNIVYEPEANEMLAALKEGEAAMRRSRQVRTSGFLARLIPMRRRR
jgi:hypothetical protein